MKWMIAVIVGVLLVYPINLLIQYIARLQAGSDNIWYGYALSALMFVFYFLPGMFLASLQNLRATGTGWRFRWPEFALGIFLLIMSAAMKLEEATGLVTAVEFIRSSAILMQIVTFSDGLYLWVVLAGFFMMDAFERVSEESIARAAALRAEAAEARIARKNARKSARKASEKAAEPVAAQPEAQPAAETRQAAPENLGPGA